MILKQHIFLSVAIITLFLSIIIFFFYLTSLIYDINWPGFFWLITISLLLFFTFKFQLKCKNFDLFHPLVSSALFFIIPMVLIKGTYLVLGGHTSIDLMTNEKFIVNLTLFYFFLGWLALTIGFYSPFGQYLAYRIKLPKFFKKEHYLKLSSLVIIFIIGCLCIIILAQKKAFGAPLTDYIEDLTFVSTVRPFIQWVYMSLFLISFEKSRRNHKFKWKLLLTTFFIIAIIFSFLSGWRHQIFWIFLLIIAGSYYSQYPKIKWKRLIILFLISFIALSFSMLVITEYRLIRYQSFRYEPLSLYEIHQTLIVTINQIRQVHLFENIKLIFDRLFERLNSFDLLAITLAKAEELKAMEEAIGIKNNIFKEIILNVIPRTIWPDKPILSDFGLLFSWLYLGTPYLTWSGPSVIGDLYRNFGFLGVLFGMIILGIYLRFLYDSLIKIGKIEPLKALLYFFLYNSINWEGQYSSFITSGSRALIAFLVLVWFLYITRGLVYVYKKA